MSGLTRQEMKRDEVREGLISIVDWIADNVQKILIGIGLVIVALIALWFVGEMLQNRAEEAQQQLAEALDVYSAPVGAAATEADDETFATEADRRARAAELFAAIPGSTDAGEVASVYLADIAAAEGRYDEAREGWQSFVDDHGDHALSAVVQTSLISLDREQGRTEQLLERLRGLEESSNPVLPRDVLLFELGVTLEDAGQVEEAGETFRRLTEEFPQSPYAQRARSRPSFSAEVG